MQPIVIYHGECADGFTGAWVAHQKFHGEVNLHAALHGSSPPELQDREVFLVDFAYPLQTMLEIREKARRLVVLDHHKTTAADLAGVEGIETTLDMNRSGSHIAWDYFFPNTAPPELLLYVEDQDLGKFSMPFSREVNEAMFAYSLNLAVWDRLMRTDISVLMHEGVILHRKLMQDLARLTPALTRRLLIGGYQVPAINLPFTLAPHAVEALCHGEPFAAGYWDTPRYRQFSLRSSAKGLDVSGIAREYGGGGHARSAGFRVSLKDVGLFEIGQ